MQSGVLFLKHLSFLQGGYVVTLDAARNAILTSTGAVDHEKISVSEAGGRVVGEAITTPVPLPPYRMALTSGVAVMGAGEGDDGPSRVAGGQPVPPGVLGLAHAQGLAPDADAVAEPGSLARAGDVIIPKGKALSALDLRLLAELGIRRVVVHRRPRVAVVAVGDELATLDEGLGPGKWYDGATPMLAALLGWWGAIPVALGPTARRSEDMEFAMSKALDEDDAVVFVAAQGSHDDHLARILAKRGLEPKFSGVALTPGGDILFGLVRGKPVIAMPWQAADVLVDAELFLKPLVQRLGGLTVQEPRKVAALLDDTLVGWAPGTCTVWALSLRIHERPYKASVVKGWPHGVVYHSAAVQGLCLSPEGRDLKAGFSVDVLPLGPVVL